ncbi:MAG TPA: hypothetical protein VMB47_12940 [Candidatus Aquilonibacter sp.]|nr:hypothetical protein [Candidatus Aquilonibacter sp.]
MSEQPKQTEQNDQRGPGYEVRDANIKALLQFAFWLAVLLAVTLVAMRYTFHILKGVTPLGPAASPFANTRQIPEGPLLQAHPHEDLVTFCSEQRQQVNGYAWINKAGGIVQIPIDQAMNIVLQKGLPSRTAQQAAQLAPSEGTIVPVGAAGEPDATYLQGPCGYLADPEAAAAVPKD